MRSKRASRAGRRSGARGQAAVETVLVLPLAVFLYLGILQMAVLMQARFATEYAAFRAVRAGAIGQVRCALMRQAALQALLPTARRTDTPARIRQAWETFRSNSYGGHLAGQRIVQLRLRVEDLGSAFAEGYDFDEPLEDAAQTAHVTAQLTYWYELRIPFANWTIHQAWRGVSALDAPSPPGAYLLPIRAESSLRLMSNLDPLEPPEALCE